MLTYIVAHWQGKFGLAKSFLLNGVAIFVLLNLVLYALYWFGVGVSQIVLYSWIVLVVVWAIWACVGTFRSGVRAAFDNTSGRARGVAGLLVAISVVAFVWFMARDLYHLLILR